MATSGRTTAGQAYRFEAKETKKIQNKNLTFIFSKIEIPLVFYGPPLG
jgi:hypothetical protein